MSDQSDTTDPDIVTRLNDACIGHPHARIPWPHRLLHDARDEIERKHTEEMRLSQGLCAIAEAAEDVPASVLRRIAYDIALNCITPDVARFQIERRAKMGNESDV